MGVEHKIRRYVSQTRRPIIEHNVVTDAQGLQQYAVTSLLILDTRGGRDDSR